MKKSELKQIIREEIRKVLNEDQAIIDKILDKISSSGIESLTPEEKKYLDTGGKSDIPSSEVSVYVGEPYNELYKIENFPALSNVKDVEFDCDDTEDPSTCENYPEMMEMLKNKKFKLILDKIHKEEASLQSGEPLYFNGIDFEGNFSSPIKTAYAQVAGDGYLHIVDSLSQFSDTYQSEEDWEIESWKKL